jgi:hypothetical protein
MNKEDDQNRRDEDGHAVEAEGKPQIVFKENAGKTSADDIAQIKTQVG